MQDLLWDQLVVRLERGATLAEVEEELVEGPGLSEDELAALWLAAWSYRPGGTDLADRRLTQIA